MEENRPNNRAAHINQLILEGIPASNASGFRVDQVDLPTVTCILPFHAKQIRPGNTISGPTMMMLADAAMYALILALDDTQRMSVTQDLHIHFLARPAAAQDLQAIVTLVKQGRRSVVMRVDIYSVASESEKKLVAFATGTYALVI
ncbi:PaaI family thioesterase [Aquirhabdus parva]|uniref:PaaI family thioesterase n=1 Tax=Aquirhabdus parva TaxID=2283318 RepID=A0A345P5G9_9GAMM|nr:PaaI family thioesterase [Aquirhabdus parva]AXI02528.1 PaaI family thioesterase [Aquirhabdus parva]